MENKRKLVLSRHCNTKGFKSTDDPLHCGDPTCHNCNEDDRLFCEYVQRMKPEDWANNTLKDIDFDLGDFSNMLLYGVDVVRIPPPLDSEKLAEIHNRISDNNPHMKIEKLTPSEVVEKYGHLLTIEQMDNILSKKDDSKTK